MALACAAIPRGKNERIQSFYSHWTTAQAEAMLLHLSTSLPLYTKAKGARPKWTKAAKYANLLLQD